MFKFHIFHNWSNWTIDSGREIDIFSCEESFNNYPLYTLRRIVQKRTCSVCGFSEFKTKEIKSN